MKKLFTALLLSLALFSVACSKYDYSSQEAFEKSFAEQCEKDGVKERDAERAVVGIIEFEYGKDALKVNQIKDKEEQEEASLKLMKKAIDNRSPKELIEYAEKEFRNK